MKMLKLHKETLKMDNQEIKMFNKELILFKLELTDKEHMTKIPKEELTKMLLFKKF